MFNLKLLRLVLIFVVCFLTAFAWANMGIEVGPPGWKEGEGKGWFSDVPFGLANVVWVDVGSSKWDVKADVSVKDGKGVMLKEKPVPIGGPAYEETLYAAFKSKNLPGYDIFTITPGHLSPMARTIEVDYIGMKKDGNSVYLEIVYRTNKAFDFEVVPGYAQDPNFTEIYPVISTIYNTRFYISARETKDWQSASLEINPAIKGEISKLDLAAGYLEKLDKSWRVEEEKFVWDERLISVDSASQIGDSMKSGFGVPKIRLLSYSNMLIEMSYSQPVLQRGIVVFTKDGIRKNGTIAVTF